MPTEPYLTSLARSTDVELLEAVKERTRDGKEEGFTFRYKARSYTGAVSVGPQSGLAESTVITIAESK